MCCFTGTVNEVEKTRIFARGLPNGRQFIAYQMQVEAPANIAMVLPIPVKQPAMEEDLNWISFEDYPEFFRDLNSLGYSGGFKTAGGRELEVKRVGAYDASFVPTQNDFERLADRLKINLNTKMWSELPGYKNYGFAVFKLREGKHAYHPMVFDFPRRDPKKVFFPTVHIHDGEVHDKAHFDHLLYLQTEQDGAQLAKDWIESDRLPDSNERIKAKKAQRVVDPAKHVYRMQIVGERDNIDTLA